MKGIHEILHVLDMGYGKKSPCFSSFFHVNVGKYSILQFTCILSWATKKKMLFSANIPFPIMTIKNPPFEDVCPINNGDSPMSC